MANFGVAVVSIATAKGSNIVSVIALLRAKSGVVARSQPNGLSKTTTFSLDSYIHIYRNTLNHRGNHIKHNKAHMTILNLLEFVQENVHQMERHSISQLHVNNVTNDVYCIGMCF